MIRSEEKRTSERVSLETRSLIIAQTENKTLRETVRITAELFPEALHASGSHVFSSQIMFTEKQIKLLERVRELKSHSNFGAFMGEIVTALAKEYLDQRKNHQSNAREVRRKATPLWCHNLLMAEKTFGFSKMDRFRKPL